MTDTPIEFWINCFHLADKPKKHRLDWHTSWAECEEQIAESPVGQYREWVYDRTLYWRVFNESSYTTSMSYHPPETVRYRIARERRAEQAAGTSRVL